MSDIYFDTQARLQQQADVEGRSIYDVAADMGLLPPTGQGVARAAEAGFTSHPFIPFKDTYQPVGTAENVAYQAGRLIPDLASLLVTGGVASILGRGAIAAAPSLARIAAMRGVPAAAELGTAFGTTESLKSYARGENPEEILTAGAKGAAVGASLGVAGELFANSVAKIGAEVFTLATVPRLVNGELPDSSDFLASSLLIGGLRGGNALASYIGQRVGMSAAEVKAKVEAKFEQEQGRKPTTDEITATLGGAVKEDMQAQQAIPEGQAPKPAPETPAASAEPVKPGPVPVTAPGAEVPPTEPVLAPEAPVKPTYEPVLPPKLILLTDEEGRPIPESPTRPLGSPPLNASTPEAPTGPVSESVATTVPLQPAQTIPAKYTVGGVLKQGKLSGDEMMNLISVLAKARGDFNPLAGETFEAVLKRAVQEKATPAIAERLGFKLETPLKDVVEGKAPLPKAFILGNVPPNIKSEIDGFVSSLSGIVNQDKALKLGSAEFAKLSPQAKDYIRNTMHSVGREITPVPFSALSEEELASMQFGAPGKTAGRPSGLTFPSGGGWPRFYAWKNQFDQESQAIIDSKLNAIKERLGKPALTLTQVRANLPTELKGIALRPTEVAPAAEPKLAAPLPRQMTVLSRLERSKEDSILNEIRSLPENERITAQTIWTKAQVKYPNSFVARRNAFVENLYNYFSKLAPLGGINRDVFKVVDDVVNPTRTWGDARPYVASMLNYMGSLQRGAVESAMRLFRIPYYYVREFTQLAAQIDNMAQSWATRLERHWYMRLNLPAESQAKLNALDNYILQYRKVFVESPKTRFELPLSALKDKFGLNDEEIQAYKEFQTGLQYFWNVPLRRFFASKSISASNIDEAMQSYTRQYYRSAKRMGRYAFGAKRGGKIVAWYEQAPSIPEAEAGRTAMMNRLSNITIDMWPVEAGKIQSFQELPTILDDATKAVLIVKDANREILETREYKSIHRATSARQKLLTSYSKITPFGIYDVSVISKDPAILFSKLELNALEAAVRKHPEFGLGAEDVSAVEKLAGARFLEFFAKGRFAPTRQIPGYDITAESHRDFLTNMTRTIANQVHSKQLEEYASRPETIPSVALKTLNMGAEEKAQYLSNVKSYLASLKDFTENVRVYEGNWNVGVRRVMYLTFLGAKLSFPILNWTQRVVMGFPAMVQITGSVSKSIKLFNWAQTEEISLWKAAYRAWKADSRAPLENAILASKTLTQREQTHLVRMLRGGEFGAIRQQEFTGLQKGLSKLEQAANYFGNLSESSNRLHGALMVARYATEAKIPYVDTKALLTDYEARANILYHTANRPEAARGLLAPLMIFKTFPINYLRFMGDLFGKDKKAFYTGLALMTVLGGAVGLPGVMESMNLLDNIITGEIPVVGREQVEYGLTRPDWRFLRWNAEQMLQNQAATKAFFYGVPSLLNINAPVFLGQTDLFSLAPFNMIQGISSGIASFNRPGVSISKQFVSTFAPISVRKLQKGAEMYATGEMPRSAKDTYRLSEEDIKTATPMARQAMTQIYREMPRDARFSDILTTLLGFQSQRTGRFLESVMTAKDVASKYKQLSAYFNNEYAVAQVKKDYARANQLAQLASSYGININSASVKEALARR